MAGILALTSVATDENGDLIFSLSRHLKFGQMMVLTIWWVEALSMALHQPGPTGMARMQRQFFVN